LRSIAVPGTEEGASMLFVERTFRDALGAIVIQSRLRPGASRQDLEKQMFPGLQVGLPGWQRAHSQGAGMGVESPDAIRYAPEAVNQQYQRLGIERHIRELFSRKPPDVELWLTTVTSTHPRTLRLKEIQYRLDAVRGAQSRRLFEASIAVSDDRDNPSVTVQATPLGTIQ
jgi:hypothetical protein